MSVSAPDPNAAVPAPPVQVDPVPSQPDPIVVAPPSAADQLHATVADVAAEVPKIVSTLAEVRELEKQLSANAGKLHPKIKAAGVVAVVVVAVEAAAKIFLGVDVSAPVDGLIAGVAPVVAGYLQPS